MSAPSADAPGVVVFPPLLFAGTLAAGLLLHIFVRWPLGAPLWLRLGGGGLGIACAGIAGWGVRTMKRGGTNVSPMDPSLAVVTDGPFRFSRNPLYLSVLGIYLGIAIASDIAWPLALAVPLVGVLHRGIVLREERYLERKFGESYRAYRSRVRRYL